VADHCAGRRRSWLRSEPGAVGMLHRGARCRTISRMKKLPEIVVFGVGGTIAMTGEDGASVMPRLDARALVEAVPTLADVASISVRTVAVMPSPHMNANTVMSVVEAVTGAIDAGADGVV